jgi:cytochrome c-type biogenesis protein CcmH/NrfF
VLKLLTLALWIAPAVLLFVYLLWLSKGTRISRSAAPRSAHRAVSDASEAAGQPVERAS